MYTEEKLLYILIASTLIVGTVIGYFLVSLVRAQRNYLRQHELQDEAKIVALEKERQIIAADLHDDIGPVLSATMFKLGEINPDKLREQQLLREAIEHIDGIFSRLREISSMLVPSSLEKKGPLFAIEEFNSMYNVDRSLAVNITPVFCEGLSPQSSLHLYRILQEIVHNTLRHAKAANLTISGEVVDKKLIIRTSDDGIGFKTTSTTNQTGLGLQNLSLRARMIDAKLTRDSNPGNGTKYTIELPLN